MSISILVFVDQGKSKIDPWEDEIRLKDDPLLELKAEASEITHSIAHFLGSTVDPL